MGLHFCDKVVTSKERKLGGLRSEGMNFKPCKNRDLACFLLTGSLAVYPKDAPEQPVLTRFVPELNSCRARTMFHTGYIVSYL